jgi:hypothetical protein
METNKVKAFYTNNKIKIYSIYILFFVFISWYGATNNFSYKSFQDCLLSKVQGNAQLLTIANIACEKEIQIEFERLQNQLSHSFNFKGALEDGRTTYEIYEYLSNKHIGFLTIASVDNGVRRLIDHDGSRVSNALKGLLLGGMTGLSIGLIIELLMMLFKGRKSEK